MEPPSSSSSSRPSVFASSLADLEAGIGEANSKKKNNSSKDEGGKMIEKTTKDRERTTQEGALSVGDAGDEKKKAVLYRSVKSHVRSVEKKRLEAMKLQEEKDAEIEKDRQTRRRSTLLLDHQKKKISGGKESPASLSPSLPLSSSFSPLSSCSQRDLSPRHTDASASNRSALNVEAHPERGESERRRDSSSLRPSHRLSPARGEEIEEKKKNKRSSSPVRPSPAEVVVFERREDFNESSLSSSIISDQDLKSGDEKKTVVRSTSPPPRARQPRSVQTGERKEEIGGERGRSRERSSKEISSKSEGREREDVNESKERDGRFKRFNSQVWFATGTSDKNDEGHEEERKRLSSSASPPSSGVHTPSREEAMSHRPSSSSPPHTVAIEMGEMRDDDQRAKEKQGRMLLTSASNLSSESKGRKHDVPFLSHSASILTTADSQISRVRRGRDGDGHDLGEDEGGSAERGENNKTRRGRTSPSPGGGSPSSPTSLRDQQSMQKGDSRDRLRSGGANGGWEMSLRRWYLGGGGRRSSSRILFLIRRDPTPLGEGSLLPILLLLSSSLSSFKSMSIHFSQKRTPSVEGHIDRGSRRG